MSRPQSTRRQKPVPPPSKQRKMLSDHVREVEGRMLPHLRGAARALRPAWIERRVKDLVG